MANSKPKSLSRLWIEWRLWQLIGFVCSIAPVCITCAVNRQEYFSRPGGGWRLGIGAVICVVLVLLIFFDKIKAPPTVWIFGAVFGVAYLLEAILQDLVLLSGMALVGELIYYAVFRWSAKRMEKKYEARLTAQAVVDAQTEAAKTNGS